MRIDYVERNASAVGQWRTGAHLGVGIAAAASLVVLILAQNLGGRQLNELVLRFPGIDKFLHFAEFAIVFLVLRWAVRLANVGTVHPNLLALAGGLLLALLDEAVQLWNPSRSVEVADLTADAFGLAAGLGMVLRNRRHAVILTSCALAAGGGLTYQWHVSTRDFARGLRYERAHEFARAKAHYERALAGGMETAGLYNSLGWVEIEAGGGDPARAVAYARRALEMHPGNADILDTYGWALHHAGRHAEALHYLEQAYRLKPTMFCIHYHLGAVYLALSRIPQAESHFKRQLALPETREASTAASALLRIEAERRSGRLQE